MSKFILNDIPDFVPPEVSMHAEENHEGFIKYVSYIETHGETVVQRTFAFQQKSGKLLKIKEVMRWQTGSDNWLCRNMLLKAMGGYSVVFDRKNIYSYGCLIFSGKNDYDVWETMNVKHFHVPIFPKVLNASSVAQIDKYKYCGYKDGDVVEYINTWEKHPCVEFFSKAGLPLKASLIKKCEKDKSFCRFLLKNRAAVMRFGAEATLKAYKEHISIENAQKELGIRREITYRFRDNNHIREVLKEKILDRDRVVKYLNDNKIRPDVYNDYLRAVKGLQLDLQDTKNAFPRDFMTMHDLRVLEWSSVEAKQNAETKKELYEAFVKTSEMCRKYEFEGDGYKILIPKNLDDLAVEGNFLKHCVARMGYDKKMIDGTSLIAFVRKADREEMPFVTVEYSFADNKVRQQYGKHNSIPDEEVLKFIEKWSVFMKKTLKAEQKEAG